MIKKLRADPHWQEIQSRLEACGASEAFIFGTLKFLAGIPDKLREHDRTLGTDAENRKRRRDLAKAMRQLARTADLDPDCRKHSIGDELVAAAKWLEALPGPGTVRIRRDVVLLVAGELINRLDIAAEITKKAKPRWPRAAIASISSILLNERVTVAAAKKIVDRTIRIEGQKRR